MSGDPAQRGRGSRLGMAVLIALVACLWSLRGQGQEFPAEGLSAAEARKVYEQAKATPMARQIGLSCAFFANVPLLTMITGVDIADGSLESKKFCSSIYGLRRGDFDFMGAFDREMFFRLFHIPSKGVKIYYRDASRGELLADAEDLVTGDLADALDKGWFVSLRVLGEFGGPHNVLLLAHRAGMYYYLEPRTGRIKASPSADLASKILTISKARSKMGKRYFSAYHLVAIPPPEEVEGRILKLADLRKEMEVEISAERRDLLLESLKARDGGRRVSEAFPGVEFVTTGKEGKSVISEELEVWKLKGVFNVSKIALASFESGKRDVLPVWLLEGVPMVVTGYGKGEKPDLIFFDGNERKIMGMDEALSLFKQSGCFMGYVRARSEKSGPDF